MSGKFVCFVEGRSDKKMLETLIPRLINVFPHCVPLEGKEELKNRIKYKLDEHDALNSVFLIMCDKDREDCKKLKKELLGNVGENIIKRTKIRIACRELESFYLGDLWTVRELLQLPILSKEEQDELCKEQGEFCYEMPDNSKEKPSELLKKLTEYRYNKSSSSQSIAECLSLDGSNKSESFNMLINAIKELHQILKKNANS